MCLDNLIVFIDLPKIYTATMASNRNAADRDRMRPQTGE